MPTTNVLLATPLEFGTPLEENALSALLASLLTKTPGNASAPLKDPT